MNGIIHPSPHLLEVLSKRVKAAESLTIRAMEYAQGWLQADFHTAQYSIKDKDKNCITMETNQREDEDSFERVTTHLLTKLNKQRQ